MFEGNGTGAADWGSGGGGVGLGGRSQALSHSCQVGVGNPACLNRSPRLALSSSARVCVNYVVMRAGVYCTAQVSARHLLQVRACYFDIPFFFYLASPHGLNTRTHARFRLQLAHLIFSCLTRPPSQPTSFPATYFPTVFSLFTPPAPTSHFPTLPLSCLQGVK